MNKFEAILLFSPDLSSSSITTIEKYFSDQVSKFEGSLINNEDWGLRDLSYTIKKNKKAFYKYYQMEIEGNKIQEIKKNLDKNEEILRYLFIKVKDHQDLPTKLSNVS